jgi:hypothetical protein
MEVERCLYTVTFGNNVCNGIQTLFGCSEYEFNLDDEDRKSTKHQEVMLNAPFCCYTAG